MTGVQTCALPISLPDNTGEKMRRNENGNSGPLISPDNLKKTRNSQLIIVNHWEKYLR